LVDPSKSVFPFKDGSLIDFLNLYSIVQIDANAAVNYLEYDWSLNDVKDR